MTITDKERGMEEPVASAPLEDEEWAKISRDLRLHGKAIMRDGKHVPVESVFLQAEGGSP